MFEDCLENETNRKEFPVNMRGSVHARLALLTLLAVPGPAFAGYSEGRTIWQLGCQLGADICWAYLDTAVGPPSCKSDSIRWQPSTTNGREMLTLLHAAFLAGKKVGFWVADDRCFSPQPAFPTFDFATVYK